MAQPQRRRILVALEPVVLEGAVASLLAVRPGGAVVEFRGAGAEELGRPFDAAIVSQELHVAVRADVVITLPAAGTSGVAHVRSGDGDREVPVRCLGDVVALLGAGLASAVPPRRQSLAGG